MFTAATIVSVLLALAMGSSGFLKLRRDERTMPTLLTVGVPEGLVNVLAGLELAAAVGLTVGIWIPLIGLAAAIGAVLYFLGAVIAHIRVRDRNFTGAGVLLIIATAALVLQGSG